jgi:hypothetical protein
MGEIVWTTDGQQLWVGDGLTQGGFPVVGANIAGFGLAYDPITRRIEVSGLSADNIANGVNNKFFATELAQDAAASLFVTGTHTNISFVYDDNLGKINATVTLDGIGLTDIVADTTPQLGGNLDLNQRDITGLGNIDITGNIEIFGTFTNTDVTLSNNRIVSSAIPPAEDVGNSDNALLIGSRAVPNTLWVYSDRGFGVFTGITDGINTSSLVSKMSRGTLTNPTALQPGDPILLTQGQAYDGTNYIDVGGFGLLADINGTVSTGNVPTVFGVIIPVGEDTVAMSFNSSGVLGAPIVQPGSFTTIERNALTPAVGMMIYNTTANKFQGYQNTGGTTLEWVDLS